MEYIQNNPHYTPSDLDMLTDKQLNVLRIYMNLNNKNKHKMVETPIFKV